MGERRKKKPSDLLKAAVLSGAPRTWSGRLIFRQHSGILTLRLKHFHISAAVGFGGVLCWVSIIHEAWPPFTSCHRADHWIPSGPWGTSPGSIREAVRWARWHGNSQGGSHLPKPRPPPSTSPLPTLHACPCEGGCLSAGSQVEGWGGSPALIQAQEKWLFFLPSWADMQFFECTVAYCERNIWA